MRKYELMYIIRPDVDEETVKATQEKLLNVISEGSGELLEQKDMGKKRLAYEIQDHREGLYTLLTFKSDSNVVAELERVIGINSNVIRHIIVNLEEQEVKA